MNNLKLFLFLIVFSCTTLTADDLFLQGRNALKAGKIDKAHSLLLQAEKQEPDNTGLKVYIGWFYLQHLNNHQKCIEYIEYALEKNYDLKISWATYARALKAASRFKDSAEAYMQAKKFELSQYTKKLNSMNNTEADSHADKAVLYLFEAGRMNLSAGNRATAFSRMKAAVTQECKSYSDFINNTYCRILYREMRYTFFSEKYKEAADLYQNLALQLKKNKTDIMKLAGSYPAFYYKADYAEICSKLETLPYTKDCIDVNILYIYPFSKFSSPEQEKEIKIAQKLFKELIKYLSNGNIRLNDTHFFMEKTAYSYITKKSLTENEQWGELDVIDSTKTAETLLPALLKHGIKADNIDTIVLYSHKGNLPQPRPTASVLFKKYNQAFFENRNKMGLINIPYETHTNSEGVYVHEYFHLLENNYRISPKHGFSPDGIYTVPRRQNFPDWKGEGQFSYFKYHYDTTIAPSGWNKVLHN